MVLQERKQVGYKPFRKQVMFHTCPADITLYGGAAGPGKSAALLNEGIQTCMRWPGARVVYFRRKFPDLQKAIDDSKMIVPAEAATFNENDHRWVFTPRKHPLDQGGPLRQSVLRFSHLNHYDNVFDHQSEEYDLVLFDEATHFTGEMIEYLKTRNRTSLPHRWARMMCASNPGNKGHIYFRDGFVKPVETNVELVARWMDDEDGGGRWVAYPSGTRGNPEPYGVWRPHPTPEQEANGEKQKSRCFIPALPADNPYLDPTYMAGLMAIPNESLRRALLHGDWDIFEGQAFPEFSELVHVVDDIEIKPWWRRWRSMDWGWRDPTCVLWHAYNPESDVVVTYRELYGSGLRDGEVCSRIQSMTPKDEHIDFTAADPQMFRGDSNDEALSKAQTYARNGVILQRGINDRVQGWSRLHDVLAINPKTGMPGWLVTRDCFNLRRTLPTLVIHPEKMEDVDEGEDHCLVAGTIITTHIGGLPVEYVQPDDYVLTRDGFKRVTSSGMTSPEARVLTVEMSDGTTLTGTMNHKVYVVGKGFLPLRELTLCDMLLSRDCVVERSVLWSHRPRLLRALRSRALSIEGILSHQCGPIGSISSRLLRTINAVVVFCTGISGDTIMGRFRRFITSTTKTGTRATTTLRIWNASPGLSIFRSTPVPPKTKSDPGSLSTLCATLPHSGIVRLQVLNGTVNTRSRVVSGTLKSVSFFANNVAGNTAALSSTTRGSVPMPASRSGDDRTDVTTSKRFVLFAARRLQRTDTEVPRPARVHVVSVSENGVAPVFNLTVEGCPEYIANGVLVLNCADCLRYGLMATPAFMGGVRRIPMRIGHYIT